jgi:hypothetical protein
MTPTAKKKTLAVIKLMVALPGISIAVAIFFDRSKTAYLLNPGSEGVSKD